MGWHSKFYIEADNTGAPLQALSATDSQSMGDRFRTWPYCGHFQHCSKSNWGLLEAINVFPIMAPSAIYSVLEFQSWCVSVTLCRMNLVNMMVMMQMQTPVACGLTWILKMRKRVLEPTPPPKINTYECLPITNTLLLWSVPHGVGVYRPTEWHF